MQNGIFMTSYDYIEQIKQVEDRGVVIVRDLTAFSSLGKDTIWPYFTLVLCESGSFRSLYDMQELVHTVNDVACIMPGHLHHPLESSSDYKATMFVLSSKIYYELKFHSFSHDSDKFNLTPICHLTPRQAQHMMALLDQLEIIANHSDAELPHRDKMLLSVLSVGYEFLNLYRREQDKHWGERRPLQLLNRFSELVVEHYRESREVQFYAEKLNITPKHLTKTIRSHTGGVTPLEWIEQYVVAQAKNILSTQHLTVKETAFRLGFSESASFCRFFKRVAGVTPREFLKLK